MKGRLHKPILKKELTLFTATMYGVGMILGAGIYALIGQGAALAGNALWIPFVIAAIIASFSGLSYAELSSMYPKEAAEFVYTKRAFNKKWLSFIVGWVFIVSTVVAASTVALGFANYFSTLIAAPVVLIAIVLIALLSLLNFCGTKESAQFNSIATLAEIAGLVLIIILGMMFFGKVDYLPPADFNWLNMLGATSLMFFAYIGFEAIANVSEEAKHARTLIPKALILSIVISTILYILVSIASVSIAGAEAMASSSSPLSLIAGKVLGPASSILMTFFALFATATTVLVSLVVASRFLYGVSREHSLPKAFCRIHKRTRTPYIAIFLTTIATMALTLIGDIVLVAQMTTLSVFIVYLFVNLSVINLRYKKPRMKRPFRSPLSIGKLPVIPVLGVLACLLMMLSYFTALHVVLAEIILVLVGVVIYKFFNRKKHKKKKKR
ncbi:MAG: APC family permease [Candidatus Aenigmatarchaeota archaeon]